MACLVTHGWVPDEEANACMACKRNFTAVRRRVSNLSLSLQSFRFLLSLLSIIVATVVVCFVGTALPKGSLCWIKDLLILCVSATTVITDYQLSSLSSIFVFVCVSVVHMHMCVYSMYIQTKCACFQCNNQSLNCFASSLVHHLMKGCPSFTGCTRN